VKIPRVARVILASAVMVVSFIIILYTYRGFSDSWLDIFLAIASRSTLTPLAVAKTAIYTAIMSLALTALTASSIQIILIAEEKTS
jgi:hypothetical protein